MNDALPSSDLKSRRAHGGFVVAALVFIITELIFIGRYDHGFALGLLPAFLAGGIAGWLGYRFAWLGIGVVALLEFAFSMLAILS